jgi:hypothetical protein
LAVRRTWLWGPVAVAAAVLAGVSATQWAHGAKPNERGSEISDEEAVKIGTDAYLYGYPLVTMETTRRVMTNVAVPGETRAPMGQLVRLRQYPTAEFRDVTAPNADTLYTSGWIDVGKQPYVLSIPDMKGRYFLFPMLNAWTEVFQVPSKRTTGTGPQKYLITGPNWKGKVPDGVVEYRSATDLVWILGRIYSTGTQQDYAEVHALQDQVTLVPLDAYGKPYTPPPGHVDPSIDMKKAVRDQVDGMSAQEFFGTLANAMAKNPPAPADAPIVAEMAKVGVSPGKVDEHKLERVVATWSALEKIKPDMKHAGTLENGWQVMLKTGNYGTDYRQRAFIAAFGLGANRPADAVYPTSVRDAAGKGYDGSHRYVVHLAKDEMPPVRGFWSLTMYDSGFFFVKNPLNRYTLSKRNDFEKNPDGSVDLYLQKDDPGGAKRANWLPAPAGTFVLMMRLYWPNDSNPSILDGTWKPPPVKRVD